MNNNITNTQKIEDLCHEVLALVQSQLDDIKSIERDVFTDGEGVSYNSIVWKDKE